MYRSFGILTNARILSSDECRGLISDVKLGTDLGIINELNDQKVKKIELYTKPGNLQKIVGNELSGFERDIKRCEIIRQILNEK